MTEKNAFCKFALVFTAARQKESKNIGVTENCSFSLSAQTNSMIWPSAKLSANYFRLGPSRIFLSGEYLTFILLNN